jgi:hypothetical protein
MAEPPYRQANGARFLIDRHREDRAVEGLEFGWEGFCNLGKRSSY